MKGMNLGGRLDVVFARILKAIKRQVKSNILAFLVVIYLQRNFCGATFGAS